MSQGGLEGTQTSLDKVGDLRVSSSEVAGTMLQNFTNQDITDPYQDHQYSNTKFNYDPSNNSKEYFEFPNTNTFNTNDANIMVNSNRAGFDQQDQGDPQLNQNAIFDDAPRDSSGVTVSPRFAMKADSFVETGTKNQLKAFESRNGMGSSGMTAENSFPFDQVNSHSNDDQLQSNSNNQDKKQSDSNKLIEFKSSEIELIKDNDDQDSEQNWPDLISDNPFVANQSSAN